MRAAIVVAAALVAAQSEPLPAGWVSFVPPAMKFSVALPGQPTERRQPVKTPKGSSEAKLFVLATAAGTYAVGCTELPEAAVPKGAEEKRLDQARDGGVKEIGGRVRWEKKIQVDGCPAREIFIATETGNAVKMRLVADRNRLFQLLAVGDTAFLDSADAARFLDSFRRHK